MIVNGLGLVKAAPIVDMEKEKKTQLGVSYGLTEAGYDIRIKQALRLSPDQSSRIDPNTGEVHTTQSNFILASAVEEFSMPSTLMAVVHDKSTWARQGVSVFNTVIEPMWKGYLTLEIVYFGSQPLYIPSGSGIAQVIFHKLTEPGMYKGKYQNQKNQPIEAKYDR